MAQALASDSAHGASVQPGQFQWRFLIALILPMLAVLQIWQRPGTAVNTVLWYWLGIALIDHFLPGAQNSPPPQGEHWMHRMIIRLYVPVQMLLMVLAAHAVLTRPQLSWPQLLGIAAFVGWIAGAQGITFAHELGHSRSKWDRAMGWLLMGSVWYAHFMVEHYRGHHPRAATYDDPASARRGENVYAFWVRTVSRSWLSAWRLEAARLQQMKKSWLQSPLALVFASNVTTAMVLIAFGATKLIVVWLVAAVVAFTLLELVNYIEHYGLQRKTSVDASGKVSREAFNPMHAWNANHWLTNAILANLQRHSDHHTRAWKPFDTLDHSPPPCPQLPTGYAGAILLALVPPVWFGVMDKRLDALPASAQPA
jgi:alkane 1-monooxygenase